MLVIKQLMVHIDFHSIYYMDVNGDQQLFGSTKFFKNILFCVQHKKETYTGLEQHDGE